MSDDATWECQKCDEAEFEAKLAQWKAKQAGPKLPKPNGRGLLGKKPWLPREEFEAHIRANQVSREARKSRELSFPAPKCTK